MNRMTSVTGLDVEITRYAYEAAGRRVEALSNALTTAYSCDSVGNLLKQATSGAGVQRRWQRNTHGWGVESTKRV